MARGPGVEVVGGLGMGEGEREVGGSAICVSLSVGCIMAVFAVEGIFVDKS